MCQDRYGDLSCTSDAHLALSQQGPFQGTAMMQEQWTEPTTPPQMPPEQTAQSQQFATTTSDSPPTQSGNPDLPPRQRDQPSRGTRDVEELPAPVDQPTVKEHDATMLELQQSVAMLQAEAKANRQSTDAVVTALKIANDEMTRVSDEIKYWRGEVRRVEQDAEQQHQSDLKSLESISTMIEKYPAQGRAKLPSTAVNPFAFPKASGETTDAE